MYSLCTFAFSGPLIHPLLQLFVLAMTEMLDSIMPSKKNLWATWAMKSSSTGFNFLNLAAIGLAFWINKSTAAEEQTELFSALQILSPGLYLPHSLVTEQFCC